MEQPNINPEDLPTFQIPQSFLNQLSEFTRGEDPESQGGFILGYVNPMGSPVVLTKADSQIIEMGLRKALEQYLEDADDMQGIIDYDGNDEIT